jgi:ABC-2 type transport system ATP-binding protein
MSLLEVEHLRKSFGRLVAVDDVSFRVEAGEIFGLLGPNGAGKSTTMMMLAGLIEPDAGTVRIDGQTLDRANRGPLRTLGVAPQDLALYPDLTARENLRFFGRLYGLRGDLLDERIETVLERTGLAARADDLAGEYSGGMKRRLNFGIALLHRPRLLILDEPTVGVDPQSRSHLLESVRELRAEGIAVLYASHYMEEVQAICDRVAIMDHGRVLACDGLRQLLGRLNPELCLRISPPANGLLKKIEGLAEVRSESDGGTTLVVSNGQSGAGRLDATLARILAVLSQSQVELRAIETEEPNLERLFLELTGHRLRD